MAVAKVMKLRLAALQRDRDAIIRALEALNCVHIDDMGAEGELEALALARPAEAENAGLPDAGGERAAVEGAIAFLRNHGKVKKGLLSALPETDLEALERALEDRGEVTAALSEIAAMQERLSAIKVAQTRMANQLEQLVPWEKLAVPVEDIRDTRRTVIRTGTLSPADLAAVQEDLAPLSAYLEIVWQDRETACVLVAIHDCDTAEAFTSLSTHGFAPVYFDGLSGTVADSMEKIRAGVRELDAEADGIRARAAEMAALIPRFEAYADALSVRGGRLDQAMKVGNTERAFVLTGWVRERDRAAVEEAVAAAAPAHHIEFAGPAEGEIPPTFMDNSKLVRPFEAVTALYAVPSSGEIDPNAVMAPFFFIFFGMMVSDAGYGILIVLATIFMLIKTRPRDGKMIKLILFGGISTTFWGVLFGSWMGYTWNPLMFNPMDEPLSMMGVCFGLGLLHVLVGLGMAMANKIRAGQALDGILDNGFWMLVLIGAPMLALPATGKVGTVLALLGVCGIFATAGRSKKGIFGKIGGGLMALYGSTGYLGDLLSYARLFALGLATGVIGMVINTIVEMLAGFGPVGVVLAALVFVGGHVFNIAINVLGAYVHDSRLQYIEFFGKFFEGGGKAFQPFGVKTRYHTIKQKI